MSDRLFLVNKGTGVYMYLGKTHTGEFYRDVDGLDGVLDRFFEANGGGTESGNFEVVVDGGTVLFDDDGNPLEFIR